MIEISAAGCDAYDVKFDRDRNDEVIVTAPNAHAKDIALGALLSIDETRAPGRSLLCDSPERRQSD